MEILDELFKKIGIFPEYGIAYNINGLKEIRFWDTNMKETVLNEIPEGLGKGIFIFCYQDGKIVSIRRAA